MQANEAELSQPAIQGPAPATAPGPGDGVAAGPGEARTIGQGRHARGSGRLAAGAAGIAQGAALIASLTLLSRILGLGRTLVFSQTVGSGCLGTVYVTAYQVPNLLSELVLAGALTNAMVPVLARSAARAHEDAGERRRVAQISSAMLTWTVLLLVPVMIGIIVAAGPIATVLNPSNANSHCARSTMVAATTGMLQVFAPQVVLWGLSVVIFGMLTAYRRFTGPALGPVIANVVMIASYLLFVPLDEGHPLSTAPKPALLVLSIGATLNVAMLVIVVLLPMRRLGLRLRPTLRLPGGVGGWVGGLVVIGILEFVAQDLAAVVVIILANGHGETGALVVYNYALLVFTSVPSVLAYSITTSAFPVMSATDGEAFDRTSAGSTRAVVLMSWLGTALVVAIAIPTAHVLVPGAQHRELIEGFLAFAPAIAATSVLTNLSRVTLALRRLRVSCIALVAPALVTMAADWVLTQLVPARLEVAALALGSTIGQTAIAVPFVILTRRIRGKAAVAGVGHATLAGIAACVAGCVAGVAVAYPLSSQSKPLDVVAAVAAAVCALIAFCVVAFFLDRGDLRGIVRWVAARRRRPRNDQAA